MKGRLFIFAVVALAFLAAVFAAPESRGATTQTVSGFVVDSITGEPVPYAAVLLSATDRGALTDADGFFSLTTARPFKGVQVSVMGYSTKTVARPRHGERMRIELVPTGMKLAEVVIKPKKEKYSKKNNPAVDLMRRVRAGAEKNAPERNPWYNYDKYERITLALDDVSEDGALVRKFPLLKEHMDTNALTGRPILNVALREKSSRVSYRRDPESRKELVAGLRHEGIDDMLDPAATQALYEDLLREVDIYGNDIPLVRNRFVSPLSRIAPDFYKYYITDTVTVGADSCIVLTFVPHNPASTGFVGRLYVDKNDSTALVRRIEMNIPADINLNFINNLKIVQEYDRAPDGSRLKTLDDMVLEAGLFSNGNQLYARRIDKYANHDFIEPADKGVFSLMAPSTVIGGASARSEEWWSRARLSAPSGAEKSVGKMMTGLRQNKFFYWTEKIVKVLATGYIQTGPQSRYDLGPVNTLVSYNDLEGVRFRVGGMSTANLSPRFFTREWVAYGLRDHRWKYSVELEWSFRDKTYHSREFPVHAFRATHSYNVDMLGQHFRYTNPDNVFLSLRSSKDDMMTYQRLSKLEYILELENNFSVEASVAHSRQEESRLLRFTDGYGNSLGHLTTAGISLKLRYAPGEKFYQTKSARIPINLDAPVIELSHTFAPAGVLGNRWGLNVTELRFSKRFWLSAFGKVDVVLKGGHIWNTSAFTNLLIPNANLSYTIQPESFSMMKALEFLTDSYAQWDLTYWGNGILFNLVPGLKKAQLREVVNFKGVWGHLSSRNMPWRHPSLPQFPAGAMPRPMTDTPYMEASVGLDNIFRILRLDYVWRLTYRSTPGVSHSGLRLMLHFTF